MKSKKSIELEDQKIEKFQERIKTFFRALLVLAIIYEIFETRWSLIFVTSLVLLLTYLPELFKKKYKISIPTELELLIVLFIYASLFLGELRGYYTKYWWWDIILHTGSGIVLGFAGFLILYVLYNKGKIKANPLIISIFVFSFSVAIGTLWEIFEFFMDSCFGYNMQKTGLVDTMWDLIVDSLGALLASILCYLYLRGKRPRFMRRMIRNFIRNNPELVS